MLRRTVLFMQTAPLLLRTDEAARLLGVSRSTVYNLIRSGHLPTVHLGPRSVARIPREALEDYIRRLVA